MNNTQTNTQEWLEWPNVPIDIRTVASVLTQQIDLVVRESHELDGTMVKLSPRTQGGLYDVIVNVLQQYDGARTEQLKFLRAEVVRLRLLIIEPICLPSKEKP